MSYNIKTETIQRGKCIYKKRITDLGIDGVVEHKDAPLLAPKVFIFNGTIQYDFKNILILNNDDLDTFTKNLTEIKDFLKTIL